MGAVLNLWCARIQVFRLSRGNAWVRFETVDEDLDMVLRCATLPLCAHCVLIVFVDQGPGDRDVFVLVVIGENLAARLRKACQICGASLYEVPQNRDAVTHALDAIQRDLTEKRAVKKQTRTALIAVLLIVCVFVC